MFIQLCSSQSFLIYLKKIKIKREGASEGRKTEGSPPGAEAPHCCPSRVQAVAKTILRARAARREEITPASQPSHMRGLNASTTDPVSGICVWLVRACPGLEGLWAKADSTQKVLSGSDDQLRAGEARMAAVKRKSVGGRGFLRSVGTDQRTLSPTLTHSQPVLHAGRPGGPERAGGTSTRWNPARPGLAPIVSPEGPAWAALGEARVQLCSGPELTLPGWTGVRPSPGFPHFLPPGGVSLSVRKEK